MHTNRALTRPLCWLLMLVSLAASSHPQFTGPEFPKPPKVNMTADRQRALGLEAAAEVYKQMPVLPDRSPQTQYIRQLGQKLVATIPPAYSWPFEFHVIPQKEINAFALPGGPMFINIGTMTGASNEAELAGVMAHVYMQHSAKQMGKTQNTTLWAGLASAVLGATTGGFIGQLAQMGVQFTANGIVQKYSRDDESQADAVGAIILYKAGYDPQAMADFFQKLGAQGGQPAEFFSDHPNPGNRQQAIQKEIRFWPPKDYQINTSAFRRVQEQSRSVRAYTAQEIAQGAKSGQWASLNQKSGAVFKPTGATQFNSSAPASSGPAPSAVPLQTVLPSQHMVTADLRHMKISRPDNWQVRMPQQPGDSLIIAPQGGVIGSAVGYGVVINGVSPPSGQSVTIDQITSRLVQDMQDGGVRASGKAQAITVAGFPGRSIAMQSISPFRAANGQQQPEHDWMVMVPQRDGTVIFMVFVAPQADFNRFKPTYDAMLQSVQF